MTAGRAHPRALERTLLSVSEQGYPLLDHLVCLTDQGDDPRAKAAAQLLSSHRSNLAYLSTSPNGGRVTALNRGFDEAVGDVLCLLEPGSVLLPGALAFAARYLERHPEVDVVYGHQLLIDGNGCEVGRWLLPPHRDESLQQGGWIPPSGLFWRRRSWEALGGRIEPGRSAAQRLVSALVETGSLPARAPRFFAATQISSPSAAAPDPALSSAAYRRRHLTLQKLHRAHLLRH